MIYHFNTLEDAINFVIENNKKLSSEELIETKKYIMERFNLTKIEIVDAIIKALNKRKDLKG